MNPSASIVWQHLGTNPQSCYRQHFVNGTRIRARILYGIFLNAEEPMTPAQIAAEFDLPLAAVEEAIAYCRGNPTELAADQAREERLMEASSMNDPEYAQGGNFKSVPPEEVARILKA